MITPDQVEEFQKLAKPLIEWLNNNANPHTMIVIDCDSAQVLIGEASIQTDEFVRD